MVFFRGLDFSAYPFQKLARNRFVYEFELMFSQLNQYRRSSLNKIFVIKARLLDLYSEY